MQADAAIRVWDFETGEQAVLDAGDHVFVVDVAFLADGRLAASGPLGVRVWDVATASFDTLWAEETSDLAIAPHGTVLFGIVGTATVASQGGTVFAYDLETGEGRRLTSHGKKANRIAVDASGEWLVSGATDGGVRFGPVDGGEPHLLLGHEGSVDAVAMDPKGRWVASGGADSVIRLWPIPVGKPVHTLPQDELLSLLREATNYRVVADDSAVTGYRVEVGAFPGWESIPLL